MTYRKADISNDDSSRSPCHSAGSGMNEFDLIAPDVHAPIDIGEFVRVNGGELNATEFYIGGYCRGSRFGHRAAVDGRRHGESSGIDTTFSELAVQGVNVVAGGRHSDAWTAHVRHRLHGRIAGGHQDGPVTARDHLGQRSIKHLDRRQQQQPGKPLEKSGVQIRCREKGFGGTNWAVFDDIDAAEPGSDRVD